MNLLYEKAPDFITVGSRTLKINTDFFLWVKILIAANKGDEGLLSEGISGIFEKLPEDIDPEQLLTALYAWMNYGEKNPKKSTGKGKNRQKSFDFEQDGSVLYLELWEHFPALLRRGISYHEGIELIGLLMSNKDTVMYHRAYARCGDFSKMKGDEKKYWMKERAKYAIRASQAEIDAVFSGGFM